jgi:hypothetical protein
VGFPPRFIFTSYPYLDFEIFIVYEVSEDCETLNHTTEDNHQTLVEERLGRFSFFSSESFLVSNLLLCALQLFEVVERGI